jgi:hypothetical protein
MTEEKLNPDTDRLKAWFKPLLDATVNRLIKAGAVSGTAVEAAPAWAEPNRILIAKVWGVGQRNQFLWAVSGEDVIADHIPGSMAKTPQEAARHFALKWQMDAERLLSMTENKAMTEKTAAHMKVHRNKLIRQAEHLYELTTHNEIWSQSVPGG